MLNETDREAAQRTSDTSSKSAKSAEETMRNSNFDEPNNVNPNNDAGPTVMLNEEETNTALENAETRQILTDAAISCFCGILGGSVSSVHKTYEKRALQIGLPALKLDEFWRKFRRRFPGTYWGYANYGTDENYCIGRAVFVVLGPEDRSLIGLIDKFGWFQSCGYEVVFDAFIETQDSFSGEPHPEDEMEFDICPFFF